MSGSGAESGGSSSSSWKRAAFVPHLKPTKIYDIEKTKHGRFENPCFICIIPSEWWMKYATCAKESKSKVEDLLVISDSNNDRIVLIEKESGNVHSVIENTGEEDEGDSEGESKESDESEEKKSENPNNLDGPFGIASAISPIFPHLRIIVCDLYNNAVKVFDAETGGYLAQITHARYIKGPFNLTVNNNGHLVVSNHESLTVTVHKGYGSFEKPSTEENFGDILKVIGVGDNVTFPVFGLCVNSKNHLILSSSSRIEI
eukprot:TRINITY_DN8705_c0_g1_i3.p1 TRINITY_DN8705_c0_g1~~TRINITY_DN8705_c0_g1_i3.p1  ORF type:complete len:259 (-),score=41.59 TRINITY_DN8705_c0_g1_i3:96-872(-)